ncbi:VPS3 [Lepeophtheirus salmonis]|uniref:VPS3 n=1 Tax=Lepeophtheirus salmonis TaxID=72036 RepID=A0A7R8CLW6_LEPSM|nr:VPS3 [Lepeophtheirus salmonis]CAF2826558.1 VPS3 [Lepeophtheirus salmonis]
MSKVFELKPHLDKPFNSSGTKVESLELCGNFLFVGTSDGFLRQYKTENEGDTIILESEVRLSQNSPISYIRAASALDKLLVLCDSVLYDPFAVQICASKKKQLIVCRITEGNMTIEKTKEMPETISIIAMDGVFICTALSNVRPYITRISKEEFLLNAPNGLGMSVTSAGIAQRPPIQWIYPVNKFIHFDPYIITLSPELISVYR